MDEQHQRPFEMDERPPEKTPVHTNLTSRSSTSSTLDEPTNPADRHSKMPSKPQPIYRNSLLLAVGLLDLTNALDFPANIWNQNPLPVYVLTLMGLGGSIALLAIIIAVWDARRCWRNIEFLRQERRTLLSSGRKGLLERAWLGINTRELCWEIFDRLCLDIFMGITGLFVGTGTLLAMKGSKPTIFHVSNILSGYLGNSFLAFYALLNGIWSVVMFRRAQANQAAVRRSNLEPELAGLMKRHTVKHQLYAAVNGTTLVVSEVASMVSATIWQGYVVQAPCVMASVGVVCFWKGWLGYDRLSFDQRRGAGEERGLKERMRAIVGVREALEEGRRGFVGIISGGGEAAKSAVMDFLHDLGLSEELEARLAESTWSERDDEKMSLQHFSKTVDGCVEAAGVRRFRYEERFLLELYGYYLPEKESVRVHSNI